VYDPLKAWQTMEMEVKRFKEFLSFCRQQLLRSMVPVQESLASEILVLVQIQELGL
jgi:hypothetical protein